MPRYSDMDILDFKRILFLGGRISAKHKFFMEIAKLGYNQAREYALVEFYEWFEKHPKATLTEMYKQYLRFYGMAEFLPQTKELTRLSMILGDTTDVRKWKKE